MNGQHRATHSRVDLRRVYTDAAGAYYDVPTATVPCMCDRGHDHVQVVTREPYVEPDD